MKYIKDEIYDDFILKTEQVFMEFDDNRAEIYLCEKAPKENFVENFKTKKPFFQIFVRSGIIFLLVKFQGLDWIDIPYIRKDGSEIKKIEDETAGYPVSVYLFDINTGRLVENRHVCFTHGLSKAFYYAVLNQIKNPPKNIEEKINSIRASFNPNEIARLSLGR